MDWVSIPNGKPFLTEDQVITLMKENYELEVKKVKVLDGYDNQNFLLDVVNLREENKSLEANELTTKYVLKVTNSYLSKAELELRDVTHLMEFLSSRGFTCTKPVANKNGDLYQLLTFPNLTLKNSGNVASGNKSLQDTFMIRLVTFLPGSVLEALPFVPDSVFEEMGQTLAQMHVALQECDMDKRVLQQKCASYPWSLDCLHKVRDYLYVVEDSEKRRLVEDVINKFERVVLSRKEELPHGFIHGDFNDVNTIVGIEDSSKNPHNIGFIDFDDASYSCTVYDIGISLMYVLQCKTTSRDSAAKHFLQGYSKYREMTQLEKDCLIYCAGARFVQSMVGGLHTYSVTKDQYVMGTQQLGWDALKELWTCGKEACFQKWNFS